MVKQTAEVLRSRQPNRIGLLNPPQKQTLNVEVSPASFERALRVMDALVKVLDAMGGSVSLTEKPTVVSIHAASIGIGLKEELVGVIKDGG